MDGSFYGAVTVLAAVGYLGLVWVHRAGASEGAFSLSSRLGQAVLLLVLALHGASLLPNWFSREGLQFGFGAQALGLSHGGIEQASAIEVAGQSFGACQSSG